jgi:N-acetylneuraminic acid mutarotase
MIEIIIELNMNKIVFSMVFLFFVGVLVIVVVFGSVLASPLVEDSWSSKASIHGAGVGLGVVAVDGKIYAIGGSTAVESYRGGLSAINEVYDPVTDTWTVLASMPTPRRDFAIAAYQGKIYCIGGIAGATRHQGTGGVFYSIILSNVTEVYDTTTNSWSTMAPFPYKSSHLQAAIVDDQIFVLLGSHLLRYDPLTDLWIEKAQMPIIPSSSSSGHGPYPVLFVINEKLVVTAEFYSGSKVLVYDPKKDVWSDESTGPRVICDGVGLVTSGVYAPQRVYFLGRAPGSTFGEWLTNQAYDFIDGTWTIGEAMPNPRLGFGAVVVDDILYIIGGYTYDIGYPYATKVSALVEAYVPFGYRSIPIIEVVSPLSDGVYNSSCVDLVFVVDRPVGLLYYCVDGGANVTVAGNTTLLGLSGGVYNVTVFGEDVFGNVGVSETVVFTVVSQPDFILTVPVVVALCVVSVLVVMVVLFLRRRSSVKPLQTN